MHTYVNEHNHNVDDVVASKLIANQASKVIDDVIRSILDYQPRQICKDFVYEHGMRLCYYQARYIKDKAKESI